MRGTTAPPNNTARPAGLAWLHEHLELQVPPPATRSEIVDGKGSLHSLDGRVVERYPKHFEPVDLIGHLRFALKYEPLDLRAIRAAFRTLGPGPIIDWLQKQPTSGYARRAWYLYEALVHRIDDIQDASAGPYVLLANPDKQIVGDPAAATRHRVHDNLLGAPSYAPLIRLTPTLREWLEAPLKDRATRLVQNIDPALLARASHYLYTRETRSSYAIERADPPRNYLDRFVSLLAAARSFVPSEENLVILQNAIVDPRYKEEGWRKKQNYVGETRADYQEMVHFVCPTPEDVPMLMQGWELSLHWMNSCHPVVTAAAASFGFVLIHPFIDGNGRIHRFLIHSILANRGFTPEDIVFPVSAVMLRHRRDTRRFWMRTPTPCFHM